MTNSFCASCGAQNLGTKFCENCGQLADSAGGAIAVGSPAGAVHDPIRPSQVAIDNSAAPIARSPIYVAVLVAFLLQILISGLIQIWANYSVGNWASLILGIFVGALAMVASFSSRTPPKRRLPSGILSFVYLVATCVGSILAIVNPYPYFYVFTQLLGGIALFISWAIARPFLGRGYFALLFFIPMYWLSGSISGLLYSLLFWSSASLLNSFFASIIVLISLLFPIGIVLIALAFEKAARKKLQTAGPRQVVAAYPVPHYQPAQALGVGSTQTGFQVPATYPPGWGPRTNPMAIASLITGLVGSGVLAPIFGHIALSQIRRTGESGKGMAIAGLTLGYFWLAVEIIILVVSIVSLIP